MVKSVELVKVQTLKASHAKQIQWIGMSELKHVQKDIHPEHGALDVVEVLGRIPGRVLHELGHGNANTIHWCYLIKTPNGLYWMNAPDASSEVFKYYQQNIPQLFV